MKKIYKKSLFIFRRDLRIIDNHALYTAIKESEQIVPCFIFDPRQINTQNDYRSLNSMQFMLNSLHELEHDIKKAGGTLIFGHDNPAICLKKFIKEYQIDAVFCGHDYTPFSLKRDEELLHVCTTFHIPFIQVHDALLTIPDDVKTGSGTPYAKYTPFLNRALKIPVLQPHTLKNFGFAKEKSSSSGSLKGHALLGSYHNKNIWVSGGRSEALSLLKKSMHLDEYQKTRDFPFLQTSNLSAHLKFGTLSIREFFYAIVKNLGPNHPLIKQLYWRDFFTHVAYHSPFVFGHCFIQKYDALSWDYSKKGSERFARWSNGETGFPIVDAGMRQLITTGYMHNRIRMIVASFLTKDLHIDWRMGERFFAQHLVDYDPAVNNGNWQWAASTGCDAQPYFRIFNPWLQQAKYDPEAKYIKTWVPELKNKDPKTLHTLYKENIKITGYPHCIIIHEEEKEKALKLYQTRN